MTNNGPQVGIFYLIEGRLIFETTTLGDTRPSGVFRAHQRQHYDLWTEIRSGNQDHCEVDCYSFPRGRVSFNEDNGRFEMLADKHILEDKFLVAEILARMHLIYSEVDLRPDSHYLCAECRKKGED